MGRPSERVATEDALEAAGGSSADTPVREPKSASRGVRGNLHDLTLAALLHVLEQEKRTGLLSVWGPHLSGSVLWRNGKIVAASYEVRRSERGEAAVSAMLSIDDGRFDFDPRPVPGTSDLGRGVASIVLRAAHEDDERDRDGGDLVGEIVG